MKTEMVRGEAFLISFMKGYAVICTCPECGREKEVKIRPGKKKVIFCSCKGNN